LGIGTDRVISAPDGFVAIEPVAFGRIKSDRQSRVRVLHTEQLQN
jgi:hypothetical protein